MTSFLDFLPKLITQKERRTLEKRFRIVQLLKTNLTYRKIAQQMRISTTTAVRLNQRLKIRRLKRKKYSLKDEKKNKDKNKKLPWVIG